MHRPPCGWPKDVFINRIPARCLFYKAQAKGPVYFTIASNIAWKDFDADIYEMRKGAAFLCLWRVQRDEYLIMGAYFDV